MKNKPQWLLDAEAEIQKFEQTEWGKLTQKEFTRKQASHEAGKTQGQKNVESGELQKRSKLGGQIGGKISGRNNVLNGHLNSILNYELRSKGGKVSGRKAAESGQINKAQEKSVEKNSIPIIVNGVKYKSLVEAHKKSGLGIITINNIRNGIPNGRKPGNKISIEFNGVKYKSISDAVKQTGHSYITIQKMILDPTYKPKDNSFYIDGIKYESNNDAHRKTGLSYAKIKQLKKESS
jgi:hypothetical protein